MREETAKRMSSPLSISSFISRTRDLPFITFICFPSSFLLSPSLLLSDEFSSLLPYCYFPLLSFLLLLLFSSCSFLFLAPSYLFLLSFSLSLLFHSTLSSLFPPSFLLFHLFIVFYISSIQTELFHYLLPSFIFFPSFLQSFIFPLRSFLFLPAPSHPESSPSPKTGNLSWFYGCY